VFTWAQRLLNCCLGELKYADSQMSVSHYQNCLFSFWKSINTD